MTHLWHMCGDQSALVVHVKFSTRLYLESSGILYSVLCWVRGKKKIAILGSETNLEVECEITKRRMRLARKRLESGSEEVDMARDSMNLSVLCTCSSFLSSSIFCSLVAHCYLRMRVSFTGGQVQIIV